MEKNVLDEILAMAEFDPEEMNYIRQHISPALNEKFDDDTIQYIIDVVFEYIDQKEEDEEDDGIMVDDVAQYVVAQAQKEQVGTFNVDEIAYIVDADFDYMDSLAE